MSTNPEEERQIIIHRSRKRPYGIKISFHVKTLGSIGNLENVSISMKSGAFITLAPDRKAPWEGGYRGKLVLVGFPTAAAAEVAGKKLVQAILWMAIKQKISLQLQYDSYEPAYVFERNRSSGLSVSCYGDVIKRPEKIMESIHNGYYDLPDPQPNILLSMEIFAGAKLETSERATYLAMISALEPLAVEKPLGSSVSRFVINTLDLLNQIDDLDQQTKDSLAGRIRNLEKESIRQSLRRFVKEAVPELQNAWKIIDEAYEIRSQLIHAGRPNDLDIDLTEKAQEIEEVIMAIYEKCMGTTNK